MGKIQTSTQFLRLLPNLPQLDFLSLIFNYQDEEQEPITITLPILRTLRIGFIHPFHYVIWDAPQLRNLSVENPFRYGSRLRLESFPQNIRTLRLGRGERVQDLLDYFTELEVAILDETVWTCKEIVRTRPLQHAGVVYSLGPPNVIVRALTDRAIFPSLRTIRLSFAEPSAEPILRSWTSMARNPQTLGIRLEDAGGTLIPILPRLVPS